MTDELKYILGNPLAQAAFVERHKRFFEHLKNLDEACASASYDGPMNRNDMVIYSLVRLVIEDFYEIVLLCANGRTTGAMKILRGMFERSVTANYLSKYPEEIELFVNYWPVVRRKASQRVREDMPGTLPEDMLQDIEVEYEEIKETYRVSNCKKCGTSRINHNWNRKDTIAMAKDGGFEPVIQFAYYSPITETHPNMGAILRRVKFAEQDNLFKYEYGFKAFDEGNTLLSANYLLLRSLEVFRTWFKAENLQSLLDSCISDYKEWLIDEKDSDDK